MTREEQIARLEALFLEAIDLLAALKQEPGAPTAPAPPASPPPAAKPVGLLKARPRVSLLAKVEAAKPPPAPEPKTFEELVVATGQKEPLWKRTTWRPSPSQWRGRDWVIISDVKVKRATEKALCTIICGEDVWWPKAVIHQSCKLKEVGDAGDLTVYAEVAETKEVIKGFDGELPDQGGFSYGDHDEDDQDGCPF